MEKLYDYVYRILFIGSFVLAGLSGWEKLVNIFGYTVLRNYSPWRILELSTIGLLSADLSSLTAACSSACF